MKKYAKLALAAFFATGVSATALVAPAIAQKKGKEKAAAPGLKLTPAILPSAQAAQAAITANNVATAEPAVVLVEAGAVTPDDKYIAAALRYAVEQMKLIAAQTANPNAPINETTLAAPLDALLASPSTPVADRGRYAYRRGALSFNSRQYPQALQYFTQAKQLGYTDANLDLQIVKAKMDSGDVAGASADLDASMQASIAAGQKPSEELYRYAIAKTNQRKMNAQTLTWLKKYIVAYPTAKNWRDILVTYGLQQNAVATLDKGQKVDLYRLMRASRSLADQGDYEDYAQKTFDIGLPFETKTVITEGRAAGKVPASSASANGLLTTSNQSIRNEGSLTPLETKAKAAASGKPASQTADAYLGSANYPKAIELYRLALTKGGVANDEVNTRLGIALAMSGDKAGAKAAFAAVSGAPRSDIASLWSTWLDTSV